MATRRRKRKIWYLREQTPMARLTRDGASSKPAIRRRIQGLALLIPELPEKDIRAALKCDTYVIGRFGKKHRISFDYLLFGDLKGLHATLQRRLALEGAIK